MATSVSSREVLDSIYRQIADAVPGALMSVIGKSPEETATFAAPFMPGVAETPARRPSSTSASGIGRETANELSGFIDSPEVRNLVNIATDTLKGMGATVFKELSPVVGEAAIDLSKKVMQALAPFIITLLLKSLMRALTVGKPGFDTNAHQREWHRALVGASAEMIGPNTVELISLDPKISNAQLQDIKKVEDRLALLSTVKDEKGRTAANVLNDVLPALQKIVSGSSLNVIKYAGDLQKILGPLISRIGSDMFGLILSILSDPKMGDLLKNVVGAAAEGVGKGVGVGVNSAFTGGMPRHPACKFDADINGHPLGDVLRHTGGYRRGPTSMAALIPLIRQAHDRGNSTQLFTQLIAENNLDIASRGLVNALPPNDILVYEHILRGAARLFNATNDVTVARSIPIDRPTNGLVTMYRDTEVKIMFKEVDPRPDLYRMVYEISALPPDYMAALLSKADAAVIPKVLVFSIMVYNHMHGPLRK